MVKELGQEDYAALIKSSLVTIKKLKAELGQQKKAQEPIAIIGMGCRFPGGCHDPETFWRFLTQGGDGVIEVPKDRFRIEDFYDPDPSIAGKIYLKEAGFLQEKVSDFDARFFGISPREAVEIDPQQRLLLEVSWEALERAGIPANRLKGTPTGVFIGISGSEYALFPRANVEANPYLLTGSAPSMASGRISYLLGVHGPSMSIDTSSSSSLVAVHQACESLHRGESSLALAGGVSLMLTPYEFLSLCALHALAPDGRCKTFDAGGDGYGRGEGCGIVVLKRLSDALRDNDPILAVIKGTSVNQDGPGSGLTVPNGKAQKALIERTLEVANVSPADIGYVEVHGTGTKLGDPIEFRALMEVFGKDNKREKPLCIGSVKSNIGHLEAAAGIAGLVKSVLCLYNKQIPPHLHVHTINPEIHLESIPAMIPQKVLPWETNGQPRMLGISSFGFSGTNAHAIVSEWRDAPLAPSPSSAERPWHILALSGKDEGALSQVVIRYGKYFDQDSEEKLEDICFTANTGRSHFNCRVAFIAENRKQMKNGVTEYVRGNKRKSIAEGRGLGHTPPKIAFLINGKMKQELAQSLFETQPIFRQTIRSCDELLQQLAQISLLEKRTAGESIRDGDPLGWPDDVLAFVLHFGLLKVWEAWGVRPGAVLGSQSGELVAACAAGIMDMEAALSILLEYWCEIEKANGQKALHSPQMRMISGRSGRTVEKQEALSSRYWERVLSEESNMKKGIESLLTFGYSHFLHIGPEDDADEREDLLASAGAQYFPSPTEEDPWRTLTETLANLYCLGLDIDWSGFEQGYSRRKVLLPTYPFQRHYFWRQTTMESLVSHVETEKRSKERPESSPLDGRIVNSLVKTKKIEYRLSLDAVPDVKDAHGVLHTGYYLELLRGAVKKIYQTTAFRIQTIDFLMAIILPESGAVRLLLILDAKEGDELDFSFLSHQGDDNWNKHAQGTILLEYTDTSPSVETDFRSNIISRCTDHYAGREFYQNIQERGFSLGERVQWVEQVWAREGEALARLRLPHSLNISHEYEIGVHPGVFEGCAQSFHAALTRSEDKNLKYMVTRWEDFVFHDHAGQAFWCHVVLQDGLQRKDQLKGSFRLFDENGTVVAQIRSGIMKSLYEKHKDIYRKSLEQPQREKGRKIESKIIKELNNLKHDQWREYLNSYLRQVFAAKMSIAVNDLSADEPLLDRGIDSIVSMEAKTKLEEDLGIFLPLELLLVGPRIRELTESILPLLALEPPQVECETKDAIESAYEMDIHAWIVHRKSNPRARVKLFCFPYGGGRGASLYRGWQAKLPDYIEVCPVQLPGKGNRIKEKAFTDIGGATEVLKQVLAPELDRPYALYGHSSGAFVAYRLAYKLWSEMEKKPGHLFVGAYTSPTILPNPAVSIAREMLQEIGYDGIPSPESLSSATPEKRNEIRALFDSSATANEYQSLLNMSQEFRQLELPGGLAELQMVGNYDRVDTLLFDVPLTAIHGELDDGIPASEMQAWQALTQSPFSFHTLPGGHLFLHEDQCQEQLLELIARALEKYK